MLKLKKKKNRLITDKSQKMLISINEMYQIHVN